MTGRHALSRAAYKVVSIQPGAVDGDHPIVFSHCELNNAAVQALQIHVFHALLRANVRRSRRCISPLLPGEAKNTLSAPFWGAHSIAVGPRILLFPLLLRLNKTHHISSDSSSRGKPSCVFPTPDVSKLNKPHINILLVYGFGKPF